MPFQTKLNQTGFEKGATVEDFSIYSKDLKPENSNKINIIFFFFLCTLSCCLLSCSLFFQDSSSRTQKEEDTAPFIVQEIKGQVVVTRVNGLPEELQMSYTACFKDLVYPDNRLPGGSLFKIHFFEFSAKKECSKSNTFLFSDSTECIELETDSNGCLSWTEVYPYRPVWESVWYRYGRALEGTGIHKGIKTVPLAFNPWLSLDASGSALQLVDLRHRSIAKKGRLISLEEQDIPECRFCSVSKNERDCKVCHKKMYSLSSVMANFAKKSSLPRLWVDKVNTHISQEHKTLSAKTEKNILLLKQFGICHNAQQKDCDPPGRFLKARLHIPLKIQALNYRREKEYPLLNRGDYIIKAYLFLKNEEGENILLHRDMNFMPARLFRGGGESNLRADFYFHVPYEHYNLPAFLALKVRQKTKNGTEPAFLPFEAVFSFPNRLKSVIGNKTLDIEKSALSFYRDNPHKEGSLLESYQFSGSWQKEKDSGFRRAGWDIKLNRLRFSDVDLEKCPTVVKRTIRYVGEVCIVDPLTGEVVPNTGISIQRQNITVQKDGTTLEQQLKDITPVKDTADLSEFQDGSQQNLEGAPLKNPVYISDTSGCLRWVDKLSHKWYNREKYFIRKMIFSKKEWGFSGEKIIAINPWHWGFVFFQDITQLGYSSIRTNPAPAEPPRIVLHDFRSLFPDLIYTIDRWLGINIFQNLLFLFRIKVDRPDNVSIGLGGQRPSAQDARRGYYALRFTLVKSHTEEAGGKGNQVINFHKFHQQYSKTNDWNTNQGWLLGRANGKNSGQMMNTNLEYITHFDTYVQVRDSMVNAYTNFLFDLNEFVFIGSNNRLIVQLWPTDPQYYHYKENSCEIDPQKSKFKPFLDHDLVTPAFMGTFVPGDQRNWNIFRALSEHVSLNRKRDLDVISLNMNEEQKKLFVKEGKLNTPIDFTKDNKSVLALNNISHSQWDRFINNGKRRSPSHKLWTKLGTHWTVRANTFSETARPLLREIGPFFEKFYTNIETFLKTEPNKDPLSVFQQNKNRLLESLDLAMSNISTVLKGAKIHSPAFEFFQKLQNLMNKSLKLLQDYDKEPLVLRMEIENISKALVNLVNGVLEVPFSFEEIQKHFYQKLGSHRWFDSQISFPEKPDKWSGFNMNLFAKDRGLRVITMNDPLLDTFIEDLNVSAHIHNAHHRQFRKKLKGNITAFMSDPLLKASQEQLEALDFAEHGSLIHERESEKQLFWSNFELMKGDDYETIIRKTTKMYLPTMNRAWLNKVLEQGIHSGNLLTPEVMTFLHSLCGFWFNHFYKNYLEQTQLDTIFDNHMDYFRYYKGVLDYLSNDQGSYQQHQDLYQAMENYNLIAMDQSFLKIQNPFALYNIGEDSINAPSLMTDALYKSVNKIWIKVLSQPNSISTSPYKPLEYLSQSLLFDKLKSHRHPYFKCMANPLDFFHTEKKIIVGDIGSDYSDLKYEYGLTFSYNLQRAFDYAYSTQWSMSRSFSASLGSAISAFGNLDKVVNPLKIVSPFLEFNGIKLSGDVGTSRSDADANRRQHSLRFSDESMYFQVNKSVISIRLKNFRHCLIVRAKNQAFEGYDSEHLKVWQEELEKNFVHQIPYIKSGLMLCSEDMDTNKGHKPLDIKEDYYYLYQLMPMDRGQFQNPLSFRNRPYIMSVRGRTEMEKLGFMLHSFVEGDKKEGVEDYNPYWLMTNPYNQAPRVAEGTREMIQQAKIWDKTGFYPGVYDVNYDQEHYFLRESVTNRAKIDEDDSKKAPLFQTISEWLYENNPLGYIPFDNTLPTPERTEP